MGETKPIVGLLIVLVLSATVACGLTGCEESRRNTQRPDPQGLANSEPEVQGDSRTDAADASLVVLQPQLAYHLGDPVPFQDPLHADFVVAADILGRIDQTLLELKVVETLKGEVPPGRLALRDEPGDPAKPPPITKGLGLAEGVRIGICVAKAIDGIWWATEVVRLTPRGTHQSQPDWEKHWIANTTRFLAISNAGRAENPAERYRELLPLDGPILLDQPAYCAIHLSEDPHAADVLCAMLEKVAKDPPEVGSGDLVTVEDVMRLLGPVGDARAVGSAVKAIEILPAGERAPVYKQLPRLTKNAKLETIRQVLQLVKAQVDELPEGIELKDYGVQDVGTLEFKLWGDHDQGTMTCEELERQLGKQAD